MYGKNALLRKDRYNKQGRCTMYQAIARLKLENPQGEDDVSRLKLTKNTLKAKFMSYKRKLKLDFLAKCGIMFFKQ